MASAARMTHRGPNMRSETRRIRGAGQPRLFWGLVLVGPTVALLFLFRFLPLAMGAAFSPFSWDGIRPPEFVGFSNVLRLFGDPRLIASVSTTGIALVGLVVSVVIPLVVATLLHEDIPGRSFFRVVFLIPPMLSPLVVGLYWSAVLRSSGPFAFVMEKLGLDGLSAIILNRPTSSVAWLLVILIWSTFGIATLLFMAAISQIETELIDAARIDGASWLQTLRHVIIPQIKAVIASWIVLVVVLVFTNLFPILYAFVGPQAGSTPNVLSSLDSLIYRSLFRDLGYSSAIGMVTLLPVWIGVIILFVRRGTAFYDTKKIDA